MIKILFVLGARSEFGYILPVYMEAQARGHEPAIWACNTASLAEYGNVARVAREQGLNVRQIVNTSFDGFSTASMAKSVGAVTQSFVDFLSSETFDWVVVSGDRAEQLGAAVASSYTYVPTAHIQAGERSGNIDGLSRHAIARLAHLHFAANSDAHKRLIRTGEEAWRVVMSGAPQLDGLVDSASERNALVNKRIIPQHGYILAIFHPETAGLDREQQLFSKLLCFLIGQDLPVVWIAPNNDAGASSLKKKVLTALRRKDFFHDNLSRADFAGVLALCEYVVGNSSVGIIEAPSFKKVALNFGRRQDSRFQGLNVINVTNPNVEMQEVFHLANRRKNEIEAMPALDPYGDGNASARIVTALEDLIVRPDLLLKQLTY